MTIIFALLFSLQVHAANQCYSPEQMRAEQWLRLHSELMVITLACHQSSAGDDLIPYYTAFTRRNIKVLHDAEQTLERYYSTVYGGNGLDRLDKLRTKLGNEFGQQIADISAPLFCASRRDKVMVMCDASRRELEAELDRMDTTVTPYAKLCTARMDSDGE